MVLLPEMILLQTKAKLPRYLRAVDAEARRPLQERFPEARPNCGREDPPERAHVVGLRLSQRT